MRFVVALIVVVAACAPGEPVPGHDTLLRCEASSCEGWEPEHVGEVLDDWVARWGAIVGGDEPQPAAVIVVEGAVVWGATDGYQREGEVHVDVDFAAGDWVLAHELVHAALWAATGDGDGDHVSGDGPWTEAHDELIVSCAFFDP